MSRRDRATAVGSCEETQINPAGDTPQEPAKARSEYAELRPRRSSSVSINVRR